MLLSTLYNWRRWVHAFAAWTWLSSGSQQVATVWRTTDCITTGIGLHADFTAGRGASFEGHRDSCRGVHCPLIGELHSPHSGAAMQRHFMTASHAECILVSGCTHCDVVNPTVQIRALEIGALLPFDLQCVKLLPMHWCPMSDINIGLTLFFSLAGRKFCSLFSL